MSDALVADERTRQLTEGDRGRSTTGVDGDPARTSTATRRPWARAARRDGRAAARRAAGRSTSAAPVDARLDRRGGVGPRGRRADALGLDERRHRAGRRPARRHGRPPAGGRAAAVRARPLGVPHARPVRRPRVLIPRPETEEVVEVALAASSTGRRWRDRGAARTTRPSSSTSAPARRDRPVDRRRAGDGRRGVGRRRVAPTRWPSPGPTSPASAGRAAVRLVEGSWFEPLPDELRGRHRPDRHATRPTSPPTSRCPPRSPTGSRRARSSPARPGLEAIEHIVEQAADWLAPGGALVRRDRRDPGRRRSSRLARQAGFVERARRARPRRPRPGAGRPARSADSRRSTRLRIARAEPCW